MSFRRAFRRPQRSEDDARSEVDDELFFHLEEVEEELRREGFGPAEAREEARRRFGDLEATREYCVDQQTRRETKEGWMARIEEFRQDLAFTVRMLRRSSGYAGIVVLTLAVGIAATTVVFSLMNPYFFRPLPFSDADELVQLGQVDPRYDWDGARFSLPMLQDYRTRSRAFRDIAAYYYTFLNVTGPEGPERVQTGILTGNTFEVLGAEAALGRTFTAEEGGPGGDDLAVVSWGLWQRRWAGAPDVVGRSVTLDGDPYTIIGVMPRNFNFPFGGVKMWVPDRASAASAERDGTRYLPVARLRPGWTVERTRTELERIQADLAERHPRLDGRYAGISVKPIREALNFAWEILAMGMTVLLAAVALVLAIACVNVASLTLARARTRAREVAVRAAIGAGRGRIVRQLLTESALLAVAGGLLGVVLAHWMVGLVGPLVPEDFFKVGEVTVDGTVLLFSLGVTLLTPLLFGLAPALKVARTELAQALREGGRTGRVGWGGLLSRRVLVVAELVLAVVLVTGTGLMIRSFLQVQKVDVGFEPERLLTVELIPPSSDYPGSEEYAAFYDRAATELEALPGVEEAGQVYPLPLNHETRPVQFAVPGREPADGTEWPSALWASVTPDYFAAAGISLLAGRTFDRTEGPGGERVVVISRSLAERHLGDRDPVGESLSLLLGDAPTPARVVGVVEDVVHAGFHDDGMPDAHVYVSQTQSPRRRRFLVLRTRGEPGTLAAPVRRTLLRLDPDLPPAIRPMREIVKENTYQWSVSSLFLGVFGLVAVLLAALGVYSLISYAVSQRRRELGVRIAMGATGHRIRTLVVGEGLRLAALGGGIGLVLALVGARLVGSFLFGVSPFDPMTFAGVIGLFTLVALVASFVPAHRATRVDPVDVLRTE